MLKETLPGHDPVVVYPYWRGSEVGACDTLLWHRRVGSEPLPLPRRIRYVFDDGRAHEADIVSRWETAGVAVLFSCLSGQMEVVSSEDPWIVGHPDGILDVPADFPRTLDRMDESFDLGLRYYMSEITAPNRATFMRLRSRGIREVLWQKFVQIQMYLASQEVQKYSKYCIFTAKNKDTSELYEEGICYDKRVVEDIREKLAILEDRVDQREMPGYRCGDARSAWCQFRHLCFAEDEDDLPYLGDMLSSSNLAESEQLVEALEAIFDGRSLKDSGEQLIQSAESYIGQVMQSYKVDKVRVGKSVLSFVTQNHRIAGNLVPHRVLRVT